jgi:hypothetical protein
MAANADLEHGALKVALVDAIDGALTGAISSAPYGHCVRGGAHLRWLITRRFYEDAEAPWVADGM